MSNAIFRLAAVVLGAAVALGAAAQPVDLSERAYEAERRARTGQWVVISNHFRHSDNCTSDGCILMGPTDDRDACEAWSRQYNRVDPLDHTRCIEARFYTDGAY